jgi:hypothetical protein
MGHFTPKLSGEWLKPYRCAPHAMGSDHFPEFRGLLVQDVARVLRAAESGEPTKFTVHKCIIECDDTGGLFVHPQP